MQFPVDMNTPPYRGILSEVAREQGVTRVSIWQAYRLYDNLRIITIVNDRIEQRRTEWEREKRLARQLTRQEELRLARQGAKRGGVRNA